MGHVYMYICTRHANIESFVVNMRYVEETSRVLHRYG